MSNDEVEEHICRRYEVCRKMGKGAYGIVWKAVDRKTRRAYALKRCFDAFRNSTDAQRTYREIMYLQEIGEHDNIVQIQRIIESDSGRDIYIVFDFMETDLYSVIRADILLGIHHKYITYQLLKALKYIHSAGLIHRDIKPSNILLNSDCHVKICDFGLCRSCIELEAPGRKLTDYVATRWYRSPEILLGSTKYTKGVDMWSVGCILGEMICGIPLLAGNCTMNQVEKILQAIGRPDDDDIDALMSPFSFTMIEGVGDVDYSSLAQICSDKASAEALDFMDHCLQFNPRKRSSAEIALKHSFVSEFYTGDPKIEKVFENGPIKIDINDNIKLPAENYQDKLHSLVCQRERESYMVGRPSKRGSLSVITPCG